MNAVNAALLDAVCADLLAEARRITRQGLREAFLRQNGVNELADHGMLRSTDQVEILALDLVHHIFHLRKAHNARNNLGTDHEGRNIIGESAADHEITRIAEHGGMQSCHITAQIIEACAGGLSSSRLVNAAEVLHNVLVVRDLEIRNDRFTKALDLDILAVVLADRHGGINDVRNDHHDLTDLRLKLVLTLAERCHFLVDACIFLSNACLGLVRAGNLAACDPLADLLGKALLLGSQVVALLLGVAELLVELDDLVNEGELFVLELLLDVFLDKIRVGSQKFNIQHSSITSFQICFM